MRSSEGNINSFGTNISKFHDLNHQTVLSSDKGLSNINGNNNNINLNYINVKPK